MLPGTAFLAFMVCFFIRLRGLCGQFAGGLRDSILCLPCLAVRGLKAPEDVQGRTCMQRRLSQTPSCAASLCRSETAFLTKVSDSVFLAVSGSKLSPL